MLQQVLKIRTQQLDNWQCNLGIDKYFLTYSRSRLWGNRTVFGQATLAWSSGYSIFDYILDNVCVYIGLYCIISYKTKNPLRKSAVKI